MPRVHQRVARKDYPKFGIVKGQQHYHWTLKTGPRTSREFRQEKYPKRSQLTTSGFLQQVYDIQNSLNSEDVTSADDLTQIAELVDALGEEEREKYENMPENLQSGPTGELLDERATQCEAWKDSIETAASELESALTAIDEEEAEASSDDEDDRDFDAERKDAIQEALDAIECEL